MKYVIFVLVLFPQIVFAGSISGRLLDAETAEPLAGIEITYWNEAESFGTNDVTDSDGGFLLDGLPEGFAEIRACPEINTGYAYQPSDCREVYLAEGQSKNSQIIALQKGALVRGYIKEVNMTPMAEMTYDYDGIYSMGDGITDTNGMYQMRLPLGEYVISLYEEIYNDFHRHIAVTDISQTIDVNDIIVYSADNGATISGNVTNPGSYPYEGGFFIAAVEAGTVIDANSVCLLRGVGEDFLAAPGVFTINGLPTGMNYDVYLMLEQETEGDQEAMSVHDAQFNISAGTSDVNLACASQGSFVIGRVINESSQPVLDAVVVLTDQTTGAFAGFIDVGEHGEYIIQNVPSGTYTFTAVHSRYLNTSVTVQITDSIPVNADTIVMPYAAQKEGADLSGNGIVNMSDFAIFANQWMQSGSLEANFDQEGVVDFNDLLKLTENWLSESVWHYVVDTTTYGNIADIQGKWYLRNIQTQQNGQPDNFGYYTAEFNFYNDGFFTGIGEDNQGNFKPESGTVSIVDGAAAFTFSDGYTMSAPFNTSKNVMVHNFKDGTDELGIDIFVKKADTYSGSDLTGIWRLRSIITQQNGQPDNFGYDTGVFTVLADGSFTGTMTDCNGDSWQESGTVSVDSQGIVTWDFDGTEEFWQNALSAGKDFLIGNFQQEEALYLDVLVKQGASYSISDLGGTWYLHSMSTQKNGLPDNFGFDTGIFIFENDGSFAGIMTDHDDNSWSESGTASVDSNGTVTLDFGGGFTLKPVLNADKDVMASNSQDDEDYDLDIFIKRASDYARFNSNSDVITNPWLGLTNVGDSYSLVGYGDFAGATRSYSLTGTETVMGVKTLILRILGHGQNPAVEYYDVRIAQDIQGNLRVLKVTGADYSGDPVSWQADTPENAPIFLPAHPAERQLLSLIGSEYHEVIALDQTVPQMSTGAGPYTGCMQYRWGDIGSGNMDDSYLCPGTGFVKEVWNIEESGSTYGWERVQD